MTEKVIRLAEVSDDARHWSPEEMLKDALDRCEREKPTKALVIFLNDRNDGYATGFQQSGMRNSEIVALCEAIKQRMLKDLVP